MKKFALSSSIPFIMMVGITLSCNNQVKEKEASEVKTIERNFEKLEAMQWLLGDWENETTQEYSKESWKKENDSTYTAFSYTQVGKDTVFAEQVILQQNGETLAFTAVAYDQNDDKPVTFTMIPSKVGQFTFENKNHDFPERINYTNPVKDSIHAWIEGKVNGEDRLVNFYFKRRSLE
ncbi:DUF6265 family protein [Ulvibacter antarcticus]|uniref:DUF6265 domain-containing protein n=1 Tax=Ulvibacter antarcticus TaxID=442714 RepID=A0A3L9YF89_9FLAO|nr:DUF6265 family protein [Ulvibacter antarcticus]RMA58010.1 hypothetical protein BXY75_2818 [Ulvibacter antarcticus]